MWEYAADIDARQAILSMRARRFYRYFEGDDKWYHTVFGGKDKNEGSVQLISVKDRTMVWAGEAGDRSLWWGSLKRGGQRRVADRIVNKMKKELFK